MHKIALLQSENWILREQNKVLSKRRRAKTIRLRQGGSMTLAEGQDIQTQIGVEAQLKEETRQNTGRPRRTKKERHCGRCGNPGHYKQTCQENVGTSEENDFE